MIFFPYLLKTDQNSLMWSKLKGFTLAKSLVHWPLTALVTHSLASGWRTCLKNKRFIPCIVCLFVLSIIIFYR